MADNLEIRPAGSVGLSLLAGFFPWLMILIALLIAGLAYWLIFAPAIKDLSAGGRLDLAAKKASLSEAQSYLRQVKQLKSNLTEIEQTTVTNKLDAALPRQLDLPGLLVQLEAIARENGLLITRLDVNEVAQERPTAAPAAPVPGLIQPPPPGVVRVTVNMELGRADYSSWKSFLKAIENNLRIFDVTSFNFSSAGAEQTVNLTTYYLKE